MSRPFSQRPNEASPIRVRRENTALDMPYAFRILADFLRSHNTEMATHYFMSCFFSDVIGKLKSACVACPHRHLCSEFHSFRTVAIDKLFHCNCCPNILSPTHRAIESLKLWKFNQIVMIIHVSSLCLGLFVEETALALCCNGSFSL